MKVDNPTWSVSKLVKLKAKIDPRPPYQRGQVWSLEKQQLLIDSILNNYDIPKIYLHKTKHKSIYHYQVADGQQRLLALWNFVSDHGYALAIPEQHPARWSGKTFAQLTAADRKQIESFPVVIAVISEATHEEIRELFARLQQGVRLNPPELRNSMASALGVTIRMMGDEHKFFNASLIPSARYKRQDFAAHAFLIELYGQTRDAKASELATMYRQFKDRDSLDAEIVAKVANTLDYMYDIEREDPGLIRTKWGFVDLYGVLSKELRRLPGAHVVAERYRTFEKRRLEFTRAPDALIEGEAAASDKRLYKYIVAFKADGSLRESLEVRHKILARELLRR